MSAAPRYTYNIPELPANFPYKNQSYEVQGTKRPGQTAHYRHPVWHDFYEPGNKHINATSTYEIFELGLQRSSNKICLGHRPVVSKSPLKFADKYVWQTYAEVSKRRLNLGSGVEGLFRSGKAGGGELPTIAVWCINRPEWQIIDQSNAAFSRITVSLYDTLGPDVAEYILNHSEASVAFAGQDTLSRLISLGPRCRHLKTVVCIDEIPEQAVKVATAWAKEYKLNFYTMSQLEKMGEETPYPPRPPRHTDLATICYTSGTTNVPKGALLTHWNLVSGAMAFAWGEIFKDGAMLSYLPLSHIYERTNELTAFIVGAGIGYFTGDPLRLLEDAQILKPKFFPAVPRVLNRIALALQQASAAPGARGALLRKALEVKRKNFEETGATKHAFWDALVFRKVKAMLGGDILIMTCGSAPIDGKTLTLVRTAFCCDMIEGWGMTENCGAGTRIIKADPTAGGTIGFPHICNEIKLIDVPSMNYTAEDKPNPRGELCARGPAVFQGYYKDPKNTAEALDAEGWLHTGDVAELDSQGRFKIIDRIKNIMKLSQGEYVALEKIENTYTSNPLVAQLYVHGDSLQSHLLGVLVPEPTTLAELIKKTLNANVSPEDVKQLQAACGDPKIQKAIQKALDAQAKKNKLKGFEFVKRVHITLEPFTTENNLLTPTFKIRRRDVYTKYKDILDRMYKEDATTKL
ncbi:acetyl-CoA synthetase-like protein [Serendipita vermifera]|nr:acetyl-CoA synthetase-like protein [Serendipita vermifera]